MTVIMGSLNAPAYHAIRDNQLPQLPLTAALNHSDPLSTGDMAIIGKDMCNRRRDRRLEQARRGGEYELYLAKKKGMNLCFYVLGLPFRIRSDIKTGWGLSKGDRIHVMYDISHHTHPHQHSNKSKADSEGRKLGIRISKLVMGIEVQHWISKDTERGAHEANALVPWLQGEITDPSTGTWREDQFRFLGLNKKRKTPVPNSPSFLGESKPVVPKKKLRLATTPAPKLRQPSVADWLSHSNKENEKDEDAGEGRMEGWGVLEEGVYKTLEE